MDSSFQVSFSSAPHFLSLLLFCFFTTPFTTSFSASSTHTSSSFPILPTAGFQWPTLHFFFLLSTAQNILSRFLHSVCLFLTIPFSLLHFLSFSSQGHFLTFPIPLVTSLLFLSSVSRLKEIPDKKPSPTPSVNYGIFKHQSKQEGRFYRPKKVKWTDEKQKQYSQEQYFNPIDAASLVVVWRSLSLAARHQYFPLFCQHALLPQVSPFQLGLAEQDF